MSIKTISTCDKVCRRDNPATKGYVVYMHSNGTMVVCGEWNQSTEMQADWMVDNS